MQRNKRHLDLKRSIEISLLTGDMNIYAENPMEYTKKLLECIILAYLQDARLYTKLIAYTSSVQLEMKLKTQYHL